MELPIGITVDSRFTADPWETITDQPPNPNSVSPLNSDVEDDEWIRDPYFETLDRVVIM